MMGVPDSSTILTLTASSRNRYKLSAMGVSSGFIKAFPFLAAAPSSGAFFKWFTMRLTKLCASSMITTVLSKGFTV